MSQLAIVSTNPMLAQPSPARATQGFAAQGFPALDSMADPIQVARQVAACMAVCFCADPDDLFRVLFNLMIESGPRRTLTVLSGPGSRFATATALLGKRAGGRAPPITGHGHPRQANCRRLALAERLRRKADRIDSSRVR
jgi:hypothetical protein